MDFRISILITIFIYVIAWLLRRCIKLETWKIILTVTLTTIVGTLANILMNYIESGTFGSKFYGGFIFSPLIMYAFSKIFKIDSDKMFDLTAVVASVLGVAAKLNCTIQGCCGGM